MTELNDIISRISMGAPAILAIAWRSRFSSSFRPFLYLLIAGLLAEIITLAIDLAPDQGIISVNKVYNVYILAEFIIILLLFYRWNSVSGRFKAIFAGVLVLGIFVWVVDSFWLNKFSGICGLSRIYNSFVICLLSVNQINHLLASEKESVLFNPSFIISSAFVFYFIYKILVEVFYMHTGGYFSPPLKRVENAPPSPALRLASYIYTIHGYINVLFNLILTIAVICIRKRHIYFNRL